MSIYNKEITKKDIFERIDNNEYVKHLSQPWFDYIKKKEKTLEARLDKQIWSNMKINDIIIFTNNGKEIIVSIKNIKSYVSFEELLYDKMDNKTENIKRLLPNVDTIEEGIEIYVNIYGNNINTKVLCIDFDLIE